MHLQQKTMLGELSKTSVPLRVMRQHVEKTQVEVASHMGVGQSEVSLLEKRTSLQNVRLRTIRRYVEALGGELKLSVRFRDGLTFAIGGKMIKEGDPRHCSLCLKRWEEEKTREANRLLAEEAAQESKPDERSPE